MPDLLRVLVALETDEQVSAWRNSKRISADQSVVALSPETDASLDELGIAHKTIEDFYSEAELMRLATPNNAVVESLCADMDRLIGVRIGAVLPEFSAYYHAGRLRVLRDAFQRAAFCLGAMLDVVNPSRVIAGRAKEGDYPEISVRTADFLSGVLAHLCRQRGIPFETLEATGDGVVSKRHPLSMAKSYARLVREKLRSALKRRGDIAYFFWPGMSETALARSGLTAVRLPVAPKSSALELSGFDLASLHSYFTFGRDNLFALALPHLQAFTSAFRTRSIAQLRRTERALKRSKARACLAFAPLGIEAVSAMLAARRANMPAIVLQHGGFNGYANFAMLAFTDFGINDHYLCYGPGVANNLAAMANRLTPVRNRPINIMPKGSPSIYAIYKSRSPLPRRQDGPPRVIYVPTYLAGAARYLAGHHRADIAYWKLQKKVLTILLGRPDWEVHFRPPPLLDFVRNPVLPWLQRNTGHQIRIRADKTFSELLMTERFDLIITEAVMTVLLESIATEAQVVTQFEPAVMSLHPAAEAALRGRASVAFSDEAYLSDIRSALDQVQTSLRDDTFLFQYGLAVADEDPSVLQAEALADIVKENHCAV